MRFGCCIRIEQGELYVIQFKGSIYELPRPVPYPVGEKENVELTRRPLFVSCRTEKRKWYCRNLASRGYRREKQHRTLPKH